MAKHLFQKGHPYLGGGWPKGVSTGTQSSETIAKRVAHLIGRPVSDETREKIRQSKLGKKHSPEAKEKMRLAKLGHKTSLQTRIKLSAAYGGHAHKQTWPEFLIGQQLDRRKFKYVGAVTLHDGTPNRDIKFSTGLPINADYVCWTERIIVLHDGCHWHECPRHGSGKFLHKRIVDRKLTKHAEALGWTVVRLWEHEVYDSNFRKLEVL